MPPAVHWCDGCEAEFLGRDDRVCLIGPELSTRRRDFRPFFNPRRAVDTRANKDPFELQHRCPHRAAEPARRRVYGDEVHVRGRAAEEPCELPRDLRGIVLAGG